MKKIWIVLIWILCSCSELKAVHVAQNQIGQVLIYPYYTVNNGLNTTYSVVNTTDDTKAIKVNFYEATNGRNALSFNVYLSAYDVWTGGLVPVTSAQEGHAGEESIMHLTFETTCAPFLNKAGQEFSPERLAGDANTDMSRLREGHIVVLEMATFTGNTASAADHGAVGVPASCALIANYWTYELWNGDAEQPVTGGLMGSASLVDVSDGVTFSYDAIALEHFWGEDIVHTAPDNPEPDLSFSVPESKVMLQNGDVLTSNWEHGYQAVSAVLMQTEIFNEYMVETGINAQSELVLTMPTKYFFTNFGLTEEDRLPFASEWNGMRSCDDMTITTWDRAGQQEAPGCGIPCSHPRPNSTYKICQSSNVFEYLDAQTGVLTEVTKILGAPRIVNQDSFISSVTVAHATQSGFFRIALWKDNPGLILDPVGLKSLEGDVYRGLPMVGFAVQKYFNANAQPGLLAQYGGLFMHAGSLVVENEE